MNQRLAASHRSDPTSLPGFAPLLLGLAMIVPGIASGQGLSFEAQEIDPHAGAVVYALALADVDSDDDPDIVAVTEEAVVWYENPTWTRRDIIRGGTEPDNVCLQPNDIDGDGRVEFALGAAWRPSDTEGGGSLQWLQRPGDPGGAWSVIPITSEPTLHRIRWGDVLGTGRDQLIVAPLQGRGTTRATWGTGNGIRLLVASVPDDPAEDEWPIEVADDTLHTAHNLQAVDVDADPRDEILVAAREGLFLIQSDGSGGWIRTRLGSGKQGEDAGPTPGCSEVKLGRLGDGTPVIATIEPWHGDEVVVYTPPEGLDDPFARAEGDPEDYPLWDRQVLDTGVSWGHALAWEDLDGDADQELVVGQRNPSGDPDRAIEGPGVLIYDPQAGSEDSGSLTFERHVVEDGGVAVEDLVAGDLDGDGKVDLVAGGRATHNVRIYWNRR